MVSSWRGAEFGPATGCPTKTMASLGAWSKKFGNITRELAKSRTQLEELMHMNADRMKIRRVTDKMNELLYQKEMMWLQRSRIS